MCIINLSSGSCDGRGYRSTGVYDSGWFDGACGTGHPFYLLCQSCRECYLRENQSARSTHSDAQDSLATPTMSGGQSGLSERLMAGPLSGGLGAPDLLGAAEMKPDSKIDYCMVLVFKFIDLLEKKVQKVLVYVMISMCLSHLLTMARPLTLAFFFPEIGLVRGCMDE